MGNGTISGLGKDNDLGTLSRNLLWSRKEDGSTNARVAWNVMTMLVEVGGCEID
jgi:hypothetical protein